MAENIIKKGTANYWYGIHSVKGQLFLTATRLLHQPGLMQATRDESIIMLEDVKSVEIVNNMLGKIPIPNGLRVTTKEGEVFQFVVNRRKNWLKKIEEAISVLPEETEGR
ncbi:PH domain-containing protein [Salinicoccus sp. Marseille-QA3877]